ncbi:Nitrogen regulation protein NtrY [Labeo rohita]|uniref:Nitrogen regulation protein NtrY n=1 Tax=Labeo rohita TaxID=84645 RepID=A0ABQ8MB94_LABRO|nr:Nitrogen regulation protein NtrY [Labeo rohita]
MLFGASEGPSTSMSSSDVQSSAADEPEQESAAPRTHRRNKSISAAHPAIYLNTRSHKLLRRAVRIWKMPIPIMNFTGSLKPKPKNFQERLKRVEMLRNRPEDSNSPKPMTRSVRDQQLCSSGTDSSPSPSSTSLQSHRNLRTRTVHVHRSRRYRKQLQLYRMLSNNKRRRQSHEKPNRLEDDQRDSPSSQSPPVIRAPPRKTSRRLWRRQLDSSSSDNSPMTTNPVNNIRLDTPEYHRQKPGKPDKKSQNRRISFSDVSSELAEADCLDNNSNLSKKAFAPAQKSINNQDSSDLKPDDQTNEKSTEKSLKITGTNMEQHQHELNSEASLVSQLKIFKEELKQCEDATDIKQQTVSQEPFKIKNPSSISSRNTQSNTDALQKPDTPRPKSCVKWKNVLMQKALCSFTFPYENQDLTHKSWCRFTLEDGLTPAGRSDTDRPDVTPECPEKPDEDHIKNEAAGDAFIPN